MADGSKRCQLQSFNLVENTQFGLCWRQKQCWDGFQGDRLEPGGSLSPTKGYGYCETLMIAVASQHPVQWKRRGKTAFYIVINITQQQEKRKVLKTEVKVHSLWWLQLLLEKKSPEMPEIVAGSPCN